MPFRAVLCGMWVSVGNLSMIGVIYGSDGSVGLSWSLLACEHWQERNRSKGAPVRVLDRAS